MVLTAAQKAEIGGYIVTKTMYRETYNELYDHILNSLHDQEGNYHINCVSKIIDDDFGGFNEILAQEEVYHQNIGKKFIKQFQMQFIDTLKWQGIGLLILALMIYTSNKTNPYNIKTMLTGTTIVLIAVMIVGYARIIVNVIRFSKYSILDRHFGKACSYGFIIWNLFLYGFIHGQIFELSDDSKLIAALVFFSFASLYLRTFIRFYSGKFKVIAA